MTLSSGYESGKAKAKAKGKEMRSHRHREEGNDAPVGRGRPRARLQVGAASHSLMYKLPVGSYDTEGPRVHSASAVFGSEEARPADMTER